MKKRTWATAALVAALVLVAVCIVLASLGGMGPVAICGQESVDNTQLAYYYWSEYFYYAQAYGSYLQGVVDFSQPLSQQPYSQDQSWQDYLLDQTLEALAQTKAMAQEARSQGFSLPGDHDRSLQETMVDFSSAAQAGGYPTLAAYLQASYGPGATEESFRAYLSETYLASAYADHLYASLDPSLEEVRAYGQTRLEDYAALEGCDTAEEETWLPQAREQLILEQYQNQVRAIRTKYPLQVRREAIVLIPPQGLYAS